MSHNLKYNMDFVTAYSRSNIALVSCFCEKVTGKRNRPKTSVNTVVGQAEEIDGDINYWSKRNSTLYDGATAKILRKQSHSCGHCGLKFLEGEKVELHHIDGNHSNWEDKNLLAIHRSCHHYVHMGNSRKD